MGYCVHVEKFPGSLDGLCGRKGFLVLRDPDQHKITCSGCVKALAKRKKEEENEALLMENFEINPDPHEESLPPAMHLTYEYMFTFRAYTGAYAYRGTQNRWVVYQDGELIGRVTKKNENEYVAYKSLTTRIEGSSRHQYLIDACMALAETPDPERHDIGGELSDMLAELNDLRS